MSQKLDTSPAVIGIDIGKNSRNVGSDKLTETREMTPLPLGASGRGEVRESRGGFDV